MKNNTKLIMETWRRFLNEGDQNEEGQYSDPDETVPPLPPVEEDPDLVDDIKKIDSESDKYGDPALVGRDSSAPMLDAPDDDDDYTSYDEEEEEYYASRGGRPAPGEDTADETMPPSFDSGSFDDSLDRYDPMDDMESGLDYDSQSALGDYQDYYKK